MKMTSAVAITTPAELQKRKPMSDNIPALHPTVTVACDVVLIVLDQMNLPKISNILGLSLIIMLTDC